MTRRLTLVLLTIAATAMSVLALASSAQASRAYDSSFGTFTANNGANPQSLAVDQQNGDVYAVDIDNSTVRRFDSAGAPKDFTCGACSGNTLAGLALDFGPGNTQIAIDRSGGPADGNIYVTDIGSFPNTVKVFDNDGAPLGTLEGTGTPDTSFGAVQGVAVDQQNGDLYVATGFFGKIWRYAPTADLVAESDYEDGVTTANAAANISVAFGKVYATGAFSPGNVEVYKRADFGPAAPSPTPTVLTGATQTTAVDPSNGDVYADKVDHIDVYDAAGQLRFSFGSSAEFNQSSGVAVKGSGGPAYVADGAGNQIDRYIQPAASRPYDSSFGTFTANNGANPQSLAVDQQNGDVYAVDIDNSTVRRFDSAGAPKDFTCGTCSGNTLAGLALDFGPGNTQIAIDRSGGPADGNIYVTDIGSFPNTVKVFDNDGAPLGTLEGTGTPDTSFGAVQGVAVDQQNGDLYVATGFFGKIWRYAPTVDLVAESDYQDGVTTTNAAANISVAFGKVYATGAFSPGDVEVYKRADFGPAAPSPTPTVLTGATQTTAVDPSNGDVYADKVDHIDVYDAAGQLRFSFGSSAEFNQSSGVAVKGSGGPAYVADGAGNQIDKYGPVTFGRTLTVTKNGPGTGTVTSDPAGIACGPSCELLYPGGTEVTLTAAPDPGSRLNKWTGCDSVAGNECTVTLTADREVVATFTATPAISGTHANELKASGATLRASLNPGGEPTTWHFEYTDDADFQANAFANAISTPNQSAGSGVAPVQISRGITGLEPGTTYRFRLVATNAAGTIEGPDVGFATYATGPDFSADDCDNDEFRVGPSAGLPDCRAYEQATPRDKNGSDAAGRSGFVQAGVSGNAVTFLSFGGIPGGEGAQDFGVFVSRRGTDDWSTTSLLPPASLGSFGEVQGWTPSLDLSFARTAPYVGAPRPSRSFLARSSDGSISTIDSQGESFVAASSDDEIVYYLEDNKVYVWERESGNVALATVLPDEACATPPCIPSAGARLGADTAATQTANAAPAYVTDTGAVSEAGDRAYFTNRLDGQLYLREDAAGDNPETKHVSASQRSTPDPNGPFPATFHAGSADGSKALFSSAEELTDDANTGPDPFAVADPAIGHAEIDANGDLVGAPNPALLVPQSASDVNVGAGHIYWSDPTTNAIGRADLDGSNPDPDFITGASEPEGIAVEADGGTDAVYWTNWGTNTVGRAEIDASGDLVGSPDQALITGASAPTGIDVDDAHVYWINSNIPGVNFDTNGIGRANLDGSGVNQTWVDGGAEVDVVVNATHVYSSAGGSGYTCIHRNSIIDPNGSDPGFSQICLGEDALHPDEVPEDDPDAAAHLALTGSHLYWTSPQNGAIGRAGLDGSNENRTWIDGLDRPLGITATAAALFWSSNPVDRGPRAVGRSDLDGSNPDREYISPRSAAALAATDDYLYWADAANDSIGRSELDGSNPDPNFITGADNPRGVAIYGSTIYWTNPSRATATTVPGTIGRAELDSNGDLVAGSIDQSFIDGGSNFLNRPNKPIGVAANATHVYWTNDYTGGLDGGSIGRATVAGTAVDRNFIPNPYNQGEAPVAVAVDGAHIYWAGGGYASTSNGSGERTFIIRRDLDGSASSQVRLGLGGLVGPSNRGSIGQLALDSGHLYWAQRGFKTANGRGRIGRVDLDLSLASLNRAFVPDVPSAEGVAVNSSHLYWSNLPPGLVNPGRDLYRYDADSETLDDLTPHTDEENGADVQGVLGASRDGGTVYFVANGDLDGPAGQATVGNCKRVAVEQDFTGDCSLYVSRGGDLDFIARLDTDAGRAFNSTLQGDELNWLIARLENGEIGQNRTARVSADGDVLLFRSTQPLTGYDNSEPEPDTCDGTPDTHGAPLIQRCAQLYRYDATANGGAGDLACISCNPTGARPTRPATEHSIINPASSEATIPVTNLLRNLSADGNRVFFESGEKLLASDLNGDAGCPTIRTGPGSGDIPRCQDVYEWEAEGTGSCQTATLGSGCLYLISTGNSSRPSFFADASADGEQAFFYTRDRLVPSDRDQLQDIYRAGVGSGLASQHAIEPPSCDGDTCQGDPTPPPATPGPGSSGQSGPGNQGKDRSPSSAPGKSKSCKKGKKGKGKKGKKRRKCRKGSKRTANTTGRAGQ